MQEIKFAMNKDILKYYIHDRLQSIEQHLYCYKRDQLSEHLHDVRVAIKKIKAVSFFIEHCAKEKYVLPGLKSLFKEAGKVREMQINIDLLLSLPQPPNNFILTLRKKLDRLTLRFRNNILNYIKLVNSVKHKLVLPEKLPRKKTILHYFKKEKKKANRKLDKKNRESAHEFRMRIKRLMYVYDILSKKIRQKIDLDVTGIDKQQKKLGDWHDTYSTIQFLSSCKLPKKINTYVLKLKKIEKKQFKNLFPG